MARRDLPKYVTMLKGIPYYRRRGARAVRMQSEPLSDAFWAEYAALLKGRTLPPPKQTWTILIDHYRRSAKWAKLAPRTRKDYDKVLTHLNDKLGPMDPAKVQTRHIIAWRDDLSDRTRFANYLVQVCRILFKYGQQIGMMDRNPAQGVELLKGPGIDRQPWPDDKVAAFRETYAIGTRERLLFEMLLGTGQRIGDVLRMQWSHIEDDGIVVTQGKTDKRLWVPLTDHLRAALAAEKRDRLLIVRGPKVGAWSYDGAAKAMLAARRKIGAEQWDIHGLRYTAAVELFLAGCDDDVTAAITGQTKEMVLYYTRHVRQKVLALRAKERRK